MKPLTLADCLAWCPAHGYTVDTAFTNPTSIELASEEQRMECSSPILEPVRMRLVWLQIFVRSRPAGENSDWLVWVRDWGIWPSSEHFPLFHTIRKALGCAAPLEEFPGMVFPASEVDDLISVAFLGMIFSWDLHLLSGGGRHLMFVSHDDYLNIASTFMQPEDVTSLYPKES